MRTSKPSPLTGSLLARKGQARPAASNGGPEDSTSPDVEFEEFPDEIASELPPYSRIDERQGQPGQSTSAYARQTRSGTPASRLHGRYSTYGEVDITPVSRSRISARKFAAATALLAFLVGAGWVGMTWIERSERGMDVAVESVAIGSATDGNSAIADGGARSGWTGSETGADASAAALLDPPPLPGLTAASGGGTRLESAGPAAAPASSRASPPVVEPASGASSNLPSPPPVAAKSTADPGDAAASTNAEPSAISAPTPTSKAPTPAAGPTAAAPPKVAAVANPAPASPVQTPTANGRYLLQLMSFAGSSQAERARDDIQRKHAELLAGTQLSVAKAEVAGRGTFYRVQTGPLATFSTAQALCAKLKAARQDCLVVRR